MDAARQFVKNARELGEEVESTSVDRQLPAGTAEKLIRLPQLNDPWGVAACVIEDVPDGTHRFSDIAIPLFIGNRIVVELLTWYDRCTAIHSHAFEGVFRVLSGASLHTLWTHHSEGRVDGVSYGHNRIVRQEGLAAGAVREIPVASLAHRVIHIARPTLTLVLRGKSTGRQERLVGTHLCLEAPKTHRRAIFVEILEAAVELAPSRLGDLLAVALTHLSAAELLALLLEIPTLCVGTTRHQVTVGIAQRWPALGPAVDEWLDGLPLEMRARHARYSVHDAASRLELALAIEGGPISDGPRLAKEMGLDVPG